MGKLKPITGADKFRRKAYNKTGAFTGKAKQGARNVGHNAFSTAGRTPGGEKIGARAKDTDSVAGRFVGRYYSSLGGATAGILAGDQIGRAKYRKESKVTKAFKMPKGKVQRITDLGSPAAKEGKRKHKYLSPKSAVVGAGVGVPTGAWLGNEQQRLKEESKKYMVKKDFDPKKGMRGQNLAFADKDARRRVNTEFGGRYQASYKQQKKGTGKKTAAEVGVGAGLGAAAGSKIGPKLYGARKGKGAVLGGLVGAAYGTAPSTVRDINASTKAHTSARTAAIGSGLKSGDVVRTKSKKEIGSWSGVKKMDSYSAFGVDHGSEFAKRENKKPMSTGRAVTGTLLGPYHGAVAGKGGKGKAKSAGTQFGLSTAGGIAGTVAGTALGRGTGGAIGGAAGSYTGSYHGTKIAHKKGWLKREKKK